LRPVLPAAPEKAVFGAFAPAGPFAPRAERKLQSSKRSALLE
jgi:hypothetical protein